VTALGFRGFLLEDDESLANPNGLVVQLLGLLATRIMRLPAFAGGFPVPVAGPLLHVHGTFEGIRAHVEQASYVLGRVPFLQSSEPKSYALGNGVHARLQAISGLGPVLD
jgi:hypothetical protein